MKRLLVFGGSGPTGRQLLAQALDAGHAVTAVVRSPERLDMNHADLDVIQGDVLSPNQFRDAFAGKDAVLSAIGATTREPTTIYSEGTANIADAMHAEGLRRLIVFSSAALVVNESEGVSWFMKWLVGTVLHGFLRRSYDDMERMESYLRDVDLDWTIIRPQKLTNAPFSGDYRVYLNRNQVSGYTISRADVAHYVLGIIDDRSTFKGTVLLNQ